jgi:tetratricopeptide (TPR) repeat protein
MRTAILVLTLFLAPAASGDTNAPAEYRAALVEGRRLAAKKDDAGAMKAFQRALAAVPDDPAALSELGLSQLALKDLAGAEASERKAAAGAQGGVKAGALYSLAMILQARGDKPGTVQALKDSLAARPSAAVARKLAKLEPAASQPAAPSVSSLLGPYRDVPAFVKENRENPDDPDQPCSREDDEDHPVRAAKLVAPFKAMEVVTIRCGRGSGHMTQPYVGVKVKQGWYFTNVSDLPDLHGNRWEEMDGTLSFEAATDRPPQVVVHAEIKYEYDGCRDENPCDKRSKWVETYRATIGVDAAGKPTIAKAVLVEHIGDPAE